MAFFPKEEPLRRQGVAMKITHPNVKVGTHRDVLVTKAAGEFERGEFVLNRVMESSPPALTKVRTFDRESGSNGNIINPKPLHRAPWEPKQHRTLEESELKRLHPDDIERQRKFDQECYEHAHNGFYENFSKQPRERAAKTSIHPANHNHAEIFGFKGLGQSCTEPVVSKGHVAPHDYNPLKMNRSPFHPGPDRPRGIMTVAPPAKESIAPVFQYDDGVKLEDMMKRDVRHPHLKKFEPTQLGLSAEIAGFQNVGLQDSPPKGRGRRSLHHLSHDPIETRPSPSPVRRDTSFSGHFPNYSMLPPPKGGYFHANQAHTGVVSPIRSATSFQ